MSRKLLPDRFTVLLTVTAVIAFLLPARGWAAPVFNALTDVAIAAMFFLHGANLSRSAVLEGILHWRLHLVVLVATFVLFPVLGLLLRPLLEPLVGPAFYPGVLFLCVAPSTVQSSIAFTSMARGNIPAAVCAASLSNLVGVFLTPLLVVLLLRAGHGGLSLEAIADIVLLLLVPFVAGHLARPWLVGLLRRAPALVKVVDDGSVLLIVYTAFSASVLAGLWRHTAWPVLLGLVGICLLLLAIALLVTWRGARALHFNTQDEIAIVFCGSKKSLASGAPMAKLIFTGGGLGAIVLPLIIFNQVQLMACAAIARHYAKRPLEPVQADVVGPRGPLIAD